MLLENFLGEKVDLELIKSQLQECQEQFVALALKTEPKVEKS